MIKTYVKNNLIVSLGLLTILLLITTQFIIFPIYAHLNTLRKNVASQQALVTWMEKANTHLQQSAPNNSNSKMPLNESLMTALEQSMALAFLEPIHINKTENQIAIEFNGVEYIHFITWLTGLELEYPIEIHSLQIQETSQPGMVKVALKIDKQG